MSAQPDVWRVSTPEGIFETDLATLKQWIGEGCVLPTDKVSKGNLSWIEAGRVPKLKGAFSGEIEPVAEPVNISYETFVDSNPAYNNQSTTSTEWVEPPTVAAPPPIDVCHNHPEAAPEYVCRMCGGVFCKDCTKFVRERVPLCPLCGDLCREYGAIVEKAVRAEFQSSGFGVEDFFRAIRYPFQHKVALFSGAVIYSILLLLGIRGAALGWLLMFGCMSHVITQVAWGRLERSFMPDFSSSSFWEDRFLSAALGVGITIISWGPLIVLVLALIFGVLGGGVGSSVLAGHDDDSISTEDLSVLTDPEADPARLEEANKKLQETRPGAAIAREAEDAREEAADPAGYLMDFLPLLGAGTLIGLLFLLFIAWGVFYYPMALTVAGYTQSFGSVINPLVGLDTIRRMRTTYFKAFAMVVVVQVSAFLAGVIISVVSSPLAVPFVGNVVGNFVNATFTFYFNLVIACVLGLSLFKCADRLDIVVD